MPSCVKPGSVNALKSVAFPVRVGRVVPAGARNTCEGPTVMFAIVPLVAIVSPFQSPRVPRRFLIRPRHHGVKAIDRDPSRIRVRHLLRSCRFESAQDHAIWQSYHRDAVQRVVDGPVDIRGDLVFLDVSPDAGDEGPGYG